MGGDDVFGSTARSEAVTGLGMAVARIRGVERRIAVEGPGGECMVALAEAHNEFVAALEALYRLVGRDGWSAACVRAFGLADAWAAEAAA